MLSRPRPPSAEDDERHARLSRAIAGEPLPCALVDLDALDENVDRLLAPVRAARKTLRLATKSLRCPALVAHILERGAGTVAGLLTYTAAETAFLVENGHRDLLLAYPTLHPRDLALLAVANRSATAAAMVDCAEHVDALAGAAAAAGTVMPVVIDMDMSYRPFSRSGSDSGSSGGGPHLGVRRSPLRAASDVLALAQRIAASPSLRFHGLMGYEAQIAGLCDDNPFSRSTNFVKRAIKARSAPRVLQARRAATALLRAQGLSPTVVNGGGSGSLAFSAKDDALTEVTAGSGFLDSLLFDYYRGLSLVPAAAFALQVTRRPAPSIYTCLGGGYVASGEAGPDRLPRPWLPRGLSLIEMEGAGEVQTPLRAARGRELRLGEAVFFRHAKAGELAEHFNEYLLVRGERVVSRAPTYRGLGRCFLG